MVEIKLDDSEICDRVRNVIGIDVEFLQNSTILSPEIQDSSKKFVINKLKELKETIEDDTQRNIHMAFIYYNCYLLCIGMQVRLPQRMENLSTKTLLQQINWEAFAQNMLMKCNEIIDGILTEYDLYQITLNTFIGLSPEVAYPTT